MNCMHPLSPASFVCCIRPVLYAYEGPISLCKNKYFVLYSIALYSKDNSRSTGISVRLVPILFARFMPFFQTFSLPFQTLNVSRIPMKLGPAGVRNANVGPPPPGLALMKAPVKFTQSYICWRNSEVTSFMPICYSKCGRSGSGRIQPKNARADK